MLQLGFEVLPGHCFTSSERQASLEVTETHMSLLGRNPQCWALGKDLRYSFRNPDRFHTIGFVKTHHGLLKQLHFKLWSLNRPQNGPLSYPTKLNLLIEGLSADSHLTQTLKNMTIVPFKHKKTAMSCVLVHKSSLHIRAFHNVPPYSYKSQILSPPHQGWRPEKEHILSWTH